MTDTASKSFCEDRWNKSKAKNVVDFDETEQWKQKITGMNYFAMGTTIRRQE
jgi:hypothetical protein